MADNMWDETLPWNRAPLNEWSICGMNHYHIHGTKFIFVSMVKNGMCITEEGADDVYLWNRLWHKATDTKEGRSNG